jgi:hypothetical protein
MKTIPYFHRRIYYLILLSLFVVFLTQMTFAQKTARHNVIVVVNTVTVLSVPSGSVTLTIPSVSAVMTAGVDLMSVSDQSTILKWGTNATPMRITIQTDNGSPAFTLQAYAVNISATPSGASAVAQFTVTTAPQTFITGLGRSQGSCNVLYTAYANASQGIGNDSHLIRFTITSGS